MAKVTKICRVCGKEYDSCPTDRHKIGVTFRWQDVACSPECGEIYLAQVNDARGVALEHEVEPERKARKRSKKADEETEILQDFELALEEGEVE